MWRALLVAVVVFEAQAASCSSYAACGDGWTDRPDKPTRNLTQICAGRICQHKECCTKLPTCGNFQASQCSKEKKVAPDSKVCASLECTSLDCCVTKSTRHLREGTLAEFATIMSVILIVLGLFFVASIFQCPEKFDQKYVNFSDPNWKANLIPSPEPTDPTPDPDDDKVVMVDRLEDELKVLETKDDQPAVTKDGFVNERETLFEDGQSKQVTITVTSKGSSTVQSTKLNFGSNETIH